MKQQVLKSYNELEQYLKNNNINNIYIVCFDVIKDMEIYSFFEKLKVKKTYFMDFQPNPSYDSVCKGLNDFKNSNSDFIIAVGGGSALDVAKCIKLFSSLDDNKNYLEQEFTDNSTTLLAIPTTAGTGSEATRYAVIYYNGKKQSITHDSIIPSIVLFDAKMLETLPLYQKKATLLDALSHAIESYWSVNSNEESKNYSKEAIKLIIDNYKQYIKDNKNVYDNMLYAANLAGHAINITQTTAGHAMCYKLTSLYGISHGHAACLVNSVLLPYMIDNLDKCIDKRGKEYLFNIFNELVSLFKLNNLDELKGYLDNLLNELDLYHVNVNLNDLNELVSSVNPDRLKNNPVRLDNEDTEKIYKKIFQNIERRK